MCKSGSGSRGGDKLLIDTSQPLQSAARVVRWRAQRALSKASGLIRRG
jgi:hypothetical protein